MEGASIINIGDFEGERFEVFLNQIAEGFKSEGLSENLVRKIGDWNERRRGETDLEGATLKQKVVFQIERVRIYRATGQIELAKESLEDALDMAYGLDGNGPLYREAKSLLNSIGSE